MFVLFKKNQHCYINKQSTTQAHQIHVPPFFPIPLWDLKIWHNSGISNFLLQIHLFLQNNKIFPAVWEIFKFKFGCFKF